MPNLARRMRRGVFLSYCPDWVSPPGETLAEILEEREMTRSQFGEKMIDGEIALAFESVLGISSVFWLNREKNYRDCLSVISNQ